MSGIQHRIMQANGIVIHVAEAGTGPAVLLCHGFPETWYSWRHQLLSLAENGYHAIAPDMRGFGKTTAPPSIEEFTLLHMVGDVVGLLDALSLSKAVIVGHDWGAPVAWNAAMMRPDRFSAVVGMSVPYTPRNEKSLIKRTLDAGNTGFYMLHFQEPGVAEAEFEQDCEGSLRKMYYALSADPPESERWNPVIPPGKTFIESLADTKHLPPWLSPEDLAFCVSAFRHSGFRGGLNWYRNVDRNWQLLAPFHEAPILVPALFIGGTCDAVVNWSAGSIANMKNYVPQLRGAQLLENAGHWVQQEKAREVNNLLHGFLCGLDLK